MRSDSDDEVAEARFRIIFAHLGRVTAFARRRGGPDPEAIAAEVMMIAWRRLAEVPADDPLPWLYGTARYLLWNEHRRSLRAASSLAMLEASAGEPASTQRLELDPALAEALASLGPLDREALLLTAWEDLTPAQAGRVLRIHPAAFRVRLLRARRRFKALLSGSSKARRLDQTAKLDVERT